MAIGLIYLFHSSSSSCYFSVPGFVLVAGAGGHPLFFFRPRGRVTLSVKGFFLSHPSEVELLHEVGEPSFLNGDEDDARSEISGIRRALTKSLLL